MRREEGSKFGKLESGEEEGDRIGSDGQCRRGSESLLSNILSSGLEALGEVNCGASRAAGFQAQTAQERIDFATAVHRTPVSVQPPSGPFLAQLPTAQEGRTRP